MNLTMINQTNSLVVPENTKAHLWCDDQHHDVTIRLMPHAQAFLYCLNHASPREHRLSIHVGHDAAISMFEFGLGHEHTTRTTSISLEDKGAAAHYCALDALSSNAHKRSELTIYHKSAHTHSTQAFRGLYTDQARAHFFGKVVIEQCAAKSTADQLYKSIILSDDAQASVMPHLEIYNHDIQASHGATIGELDYETLFYLCSRGIHKNVATSLLLHTMVNDIIDGVADSAIKQKLMELCAQSINNMVDSKP